MSSSRLWYKIKKSLELRGIVGSILYSLRKLYKKALLLNYSKRKEYNLRKKADFELDKKYGIDTAAIVEVGKLSSKSDNLMFATCYQPVPWIDFSKLLEPYGIDYEHTAFVDLGSGKGRSLFLAASLPFESITGVEFDPNLVAISKKNIENFDQKNIQAKKIDAVCMDATEYLFPNTPGRVYV